MGEIVCNNSYIVDIKDQKGKLAAHLDCSVVGELVVVKSLFVAKRHRDKNLDALLLEKAEKFAQTKGAKFILVYPGAEPFCEDGQVPLNQEVSWYKDHGFIHDHDVMGATPCMVRELKQEMTQ